VPGIYSRPVPDPSIRLQDPDLRSRLLRAIDAERRIPAALEALGPVTDRDVCVLGGPDGVLADQLLTLGGWVRTVPDASPESMAAIPDGRADVVVSGWSAFRPGTPEWDEQLASARRVLRPDGRLLVVHDYGRDEVTGLFADPARAAERIGWSRPSGPFLGQGFRVRVLHCWWQWDTQAEATDVLTFGFGEAGAAVAAGMRRPRLAWKVAVYHLGMGSSETVDAAAAADEVEAAKAVKKAGKAGKPAPKPAASQLTSA
jgi:hypothetical protein